MIHGRDNLSALRTAVPYIRAYEGRVFVIKFGGRLCTPGPALDNLVAQAALLHQLGIGIVLVHGGGDQMASVGQRLGIAPNLVAGRRITDAATLELAKMVFAGTVNTDVLASFRKVAVPAVGLSGVDGGLITVKRRPIQNVKDPSSGQTREVDFGFVGDIVSIDTTLLVHLLEGGYVPVVCSLAADEAGQVYNVNADTIGARLAVEIEAAKYFSVTTVDGVLTNVNDPGTLRSYLDIAELEALIDSGAVGGGMLPKLAACIDALRGGVPKVHVVSGTAPDALLGEVFTNEGCGTLIVERKGAGGDPTGAAPA